jgi:hypothetical protein
MAGNRQETRGQGRERELEGWVFGMQSGTWVLIAVLVLAIGSLWVARQRWRPASPQPPLPMATRPAAAARASPTAVPTQTPEAPVEQHSTFVLPWESEPTPSPTPEPTPRPEPSPTPEVPECVAVSYSAGYVPGRLGGVLVDIRAENHCGRDLAPLDVWFWVGGFRQGDLVQSVRGHPFDPIARGGEGKASIVLPGSIDWYDRIDVRVIAPSGP